MKPYQTKFIQFALDCNALLFGEFTLKSGRTSPYFFNSGLFNTGEKIKKLGEFYAHLIHDHYSFNKDYELIFGPAYKGIPLVIATCTALSNLYQLDVPYCFNRKEKKDHGEGGNLVGTPLEGKKVLVIDDVITAGTAIREAADIIKENKATLSNIVISVDRQEVGPKGTSAITEVKNEFNVGIQSIISLEHLIAFLAEQSDATQQLEAMQHYREKYGV